MRLLKTLATSKGELYAGDLYNLNEEIIQLNNLSALKDFPCSTQKFLICSLW